MSKLLVKNSNKQEVDESVVKYGRGFGRMEYQTLELYSFYPKTVVMNYLKKF